LMPFGIIHTCFIGEAELIKYLFEVISDNFLVTIFQARL